MADVTHSMIGDPTLWTYVSLWSLSGEAVLSLWPTLQVQQSDLITSDRTLLTYFSLWSLSGEADVTSSMIEDRTLLTYVSPSGPYQEKQSVRKVYARSEFAKDCRIAWSCSSSSSSLLLSSLDFGDTQVYEPSKRVLLGTASQLYEVIVLKCLPLVRIRRSSRCGRCTRGASLRKTAASPGLRAPTTLEAAQGQI